ncbi:hypothetical protein BRADI_1g03537v3 [Brachypodium distachyon]|uniref:non-specific serine/threonine protein kinase n=1 Tax=Brachypodium distachyon TaxID=15368 RepID=A0A0Q3JJM2_BRADI|nr:hypothetical protein BRADI_1g03537v3 [Brachypodium distachyon]
MPPPSTSNAQHSPHAMLLLLRRRRPIDDLSTTAAAISLLLLLLVAVQAAAVVEEFVYPGFLGAGENVTTTGGAVVTASGLLQLTNFTKEEFGHGFHGTPIRFRDAATGLLVSFSTTFVFAIFPRYPDALGHGLALAFAPSPAIPGAVTGKYLGLYNTSNSLGAVDSGIVAVELDTARDPEFGDVDDNHVGIDLDALRSVNASPAAYWRSDGDGGSLDNGAARQVWIEYDAATALLEVTVAPAGEPRPAVALVSYSLDVSSSLVAHDGGTYVGFSAANGAASSTHYVLGWSFRIGGGPAPELDLSALPKLPKQPRPSKAPPPLTVALLVVLAVVVALVLAVAATVLVRRRRRRFADAEEEEWESEYGPHRISYRDLHAATDGFRHVIGAGGFGQVYRGVLPAGSGSTEIAVKKVYPQGHGSSQQGLREFISEIASMSRLRHRNLVRLLGYCRRRGGDGELLLVYDYMPNGSLDRHLFVPSSGNSKRHPLSWEQRAKIIHGVAAGLLYLHEGWEQVVVHRDVKSSNVLLDGAMNAKLSDFGLARLYDRGGGSGEQRTTSIVGTPGYIAPEMSKTGRATAATDVFAFGAFLLEVACGRPPNAPGAGAGDNDDDDNYPPGLVDLVAGRWKAGEIKAARDPRMAVAGEQEEGEVETVLKLGVLCSHPDPRRRPGMRRVVQVLEGAAPAPETMPEDLGAGLFGYGGEAFDEFVDTGFTASSEGTTATITRPSSSRSPEEKQQLITAD